MLSSRVIFLCSDEKPEIDVLKQMDSDKAAAAVPAKVRIMGILNVTTDSFSDGGKFIKPEAALKHALEMCSQGADIIDIGGESTRPGAEQVGEQQEMDRVMPVLERLQAEADVCVSLDTSRAQVMREGSRLGASMINDVRALREPGALDAAVEAASRYKCEVCLMHMQGTPANMQDKPYYDNVLTEVCNFLKACTDKCLSAGIEASQLLVDPGFGFGKTTEHNLQLLNQLQRVCDLGYPVLVGLSRKRMFADILGNPETGEPYSGDRTQASVAAAQIAVTRGASIIRVHDVVETVQAMAVLDRVDRVAKA